jgi:hypothetical protein
MDFEKDEGVDGSEPRGVGGAMQAASRRFPKPDSGPEWTYLGYDAAKERIAA